MTAPSGASERLLDRALQLARRLERLEMETAHQERASRPAISLRDACPHLAALLARTGEELAQVRSALLEAESPEECASLAQAMRADHAGLRRLLAPLEKLTRAFDGTRAPSPEMGGCLQVLLADLEAELGRHFDLEEASGPLAEALAVAPRHHRRAASLERDHPILRRRAARLVERARTAGSSAYEWNAVREAFDELQAHFFEHESIEDAIIADALLEDHGGG